jgi:protease I
MRFLVLIAPKDFKDESVAMVKLFFSRWNIDYDIGSYTNGACVGYHGAVYKPDVNMNGVKSSDYDGIMIIDGPGLETSRMYEYRPLLDTLMLFNSNGKYVGAIGNAVKIVARANIIKDRKISSPDAEDVFRMVQLFHGIPSKEGIEIDRKIITIRDSSNLEVPLQQMLQKMGVI